MKQKQTKKILFLDDCNMFEGHNPIATLVQIPSTITQKMLKALENQQPGVRRRGGNWKEIMENGDITYEVISTGRKADYSGGDFDDAYKVISGNY